MSRLITVPYVGAALAHATYAEIILIFCTFMLAAIKTALRAIPKLYCDRFNLASGMPDGEYMLVAKSYT